MADFTVIETQEQLDAIIADRLNRQKKAHADEIKKLSDSNTALQKQYDDLAQAQKTAADKYAGFDKTLSEAQAKIKEYETSSVKMRIAHENGIPYELAARLSGDTEESIRKDAEGLVKLIGKPGTPPPLKNNEPVGGDTKTAALKNVLQNLRGE